MFQRRIFTGWLAALQLLASILAVVPGTVWAQVIDDEPPLVKFQPVKDGIRSDSQVFTASVSDNVSVAEVILHYRFDSESLYETRKMLVLGSTDIYTTTIEPSDALEKVDSIQYYIEASDVTGNRTLEGFAFDPITRKLLERPVAAKESASKSTSTSTSTSAPESSSAGMTTGRKVLYGVLGVIVVGALASSSSGGGGGAQPGVDVTVIVDPPVQ